MKFSPGHLCLFALPALLFAGPGCSSVEDESVIGEVIRGETEGENYFNRVEEENKERTSKAGQRDETERGFEPALGDPGYNPEL
jgi:hypothetical protein